MSKNISMIANPSSGRGLAPKKVPLLISLLEENGDKVDVQWTEKPGDAQRLAQNIPENIDLLVVAGGDGTLNEVVNGVRHPFSTPVAMLPVGTANLLARELGLPHKVKKISKMIQNGKIQYIDIGMTKDRRFLLVLSAGFDSMVIQEIHRNRSGILGIRGYFSPIIRVFKRYRSPKLIVQVDDHPPVEIGFVIVSNIRSYGAFFSITDKARCDSGYLDICGIYKASGFALMKYSLYALFGKMSGRKDIFYARGKVVRIESESSIPIEIDGEHSGTTPVEVNMDCSRMPILVPGQK